MAVIKFKNNGIWEEIVCGTTIEVDETLSSSGYAADAKVVGDALSLKTDQSTFNALSDLVGDKSVSEQIENAIDEFATDTGNKFSTIESQIEELESRQLTAYPIVEATGNVLEPDRYYTFGAVDSIVVTLQDINDGYTHEYCFEFTAADEFYGMSITPDPKWVDEPSIEPNKTYQVSILRGIGVIIGA